MAQLGLPALFAILIWWISTGLVLCLVWQSKRARAWSMAAVTLIAPAAFYVLADSSMTTTPAAAYAGFAAALVLWAWHEMSFLFGLVTGPQTSEYPKAPDMRADLNAAIQTVIYHEFAIALTAALAVALTWEAPNQCGTWTFIILWLMRLSTKINIYLGVPNVTEDFLPKHLSYIKSYFCRRGMNGLFPVSVTLSTIAAFVFASAALAPSASPFEAVSAGLLATFCGLGLIEHWFLVVPWPSSVLWQWSLDAKAEKTFENTFEPAPTAAATPL